jgi:hypothetical protein
VFGELTIMSSGTTFFFLKVYQELKNAGTTGQTIFHISIKLLLVGFRNMGEFESAYNARHGIPH